MSKRILFTGGGSAGHVTVNMAIIPSFVAKGWDVKYIGSYKGIEAELVGKLDQVEYYGIATGKLRRYFDVQNMKDPFRVIKGAFQAFRIIRKLKPNVLFSKGGFVSVPVIVGAWLNKVPIIIHESDITPGLANKISLPMASRVCVTFPETKQQIGKAVHVGAIVREEIMRGDQAKGRALCRFSASKPVLMCIGGSLGSRRINEALRSNLPELLKSYQIVHICGKGNVDQALEGIAGYKQYEYVHGELPDLLAMSDLVISRAGSNAIFEFLALKKPMLLIPLSSKASRGDQILNARSFEALGYCDVLPDEQVDGAALTKAVHALHAKRDAIVARMGEQRNEDAIRNVVEIIASTAK